MPDFKTICCTVSLLCILFASGCKEKPDILPAENPEQVSIPEPQPAPQGPVDMAISLSAEYLNTHCDANGRFAYSINLNPKVPQSRSYNIIRHAGTVYSMAFAYQYLPNPDSIEPIRRAVTFMKQSVAPVPWQKNMLALWSDPRVDTSVRYREAKLGGTGLGLVALASVERIIPGTTDLAYLQKMASFLLFLQKEDGGFYSKFIPAKGGRDGSWVSLYYPGEAALGLVMLYEMDNDIKWLNASADAITYLARIRKNKAVVEADHWALLATARVLKHRDKLDSRYSIDDIIHHAKQICQTILGVKTDYTSVDLANGCLTPDGRTCPTATRLEGFTAALTFLPESETQLRNQIRQAVDKGIAFLVRSQLTEGPNAGAIPRTICPIIDNSSVKPSRDLRDTEVRIDYVQHAISAMIQYQQLKK